MECNERKIRVVLRNMEWQKTIGSLRAILATFWGEEEQYTELNAIFDKFIADVDGTGIAS